MAISTTVPAAFLGPMATGAAFGILAISMILALVMALAEMKLDKARAMFGKVSISGVRVTPKQQKQQEAIPARRRRKKRARRSSFASIMHFLIADEDSESDHELDAFDYDDDVWRAEKPKCAATDAFDLSDDVWCEPLMMV